VIVTDFDPRGELIVIKGTLWSTQGRARDVELAVDTGASETLIIPEVTDDLGYGARDGEAITVIRSPLGREQGYLMRVAKFSALGFELTDFRMHIHDLPDGYGIEGILGLNFLRNFDYEVRSLLGQLRVDHASSVP
jgi:predicted aspartyl protease